MPSSPTTDRYEIDSGSPSSRRETVMRLLASGAAVLIIVGLIWWWPGVVDVWRLCESEPLALVSCDDPPAVFRWGQLLAAIVATAAGLATAALLTTFAVTRRWYPAARYVITTFGVAMVLWLLLAWAARWAAG